MNREYPCKYQSSKLKYDMIPTIFYF